MIPKDQTRVHVGDFPGGRGNCLPSVIASILEMEVDDVIQIQEHYDQDDYMTKLLDWLNERNCEYGTADQFKCFHPELRGDIRSNTEEGLNDYIERMKIELRDKFYFVTGTSPRNPRINHIVIFQNGIMVHDPHPDKTGITSMESFTYLERI